MPVKSMNAFILVSWLAEFAGRSLYFVLTARLSGKRRALCYNELKTPTLSSCHEQNAGKIPPQSRLRRFLTEHGACCMKRVIFCFALQQKQVSETVLQTGKRQTVIPPAPDQPVLISCLRRSNHKKNNNQKNTQPDKLLPALSETEYK